MTVSGYLRRGKRRLDAWAMEPWLKYLTEGALYGGGALLLCCLDSGGRPVPVGAMLALVSPGWRRIPGAVGAALGYRLVWGGQQGLLWTAMALLLGLGLRLGEKDSLPAMALGSLMIPAVAGTFLGESALELLTDSLWGGLSGILFFLVPRTGEPMLSWAAGALALRGAAALGGLPLACFLAGLCCGSLPGAVLLGLSLESVGAPGITAGLCGAHLWLSSPLPRRWRQLGTPVCILGICLGRSWNIGAWLGVSMGGLFGAFLTWENSRWGCSGARVQLELAARTLSRLHRSMLELPAEAQDGEDRMVERLKLDACEECPRAQGCSQKESLDAQVFRDPLSFSCPRTGRLLREARRVREQQRLVQMQHRRLAEYRMALAQQYGMLSRYLQRVADRLPLGGNGGRIRYQVSVSVRSRGKHPIDGDRCAAFPGPAPRFYVLLCDGMGTGREAAEGSARAVRLLREMLTAGLSPRYALGSLNAQLVLLGQPGAVTADLAEIRLDTASAALYKWGAAPSILLRRKEAIRLGVGSVPPGLGLESRGERVTRLSLSRGETLVMASDGVAFGDSVTLGDRVRSTGELAEELLKTYASGEDDATLAVIRLGELASGP